MVGKTAPFWTGMIPGRDSTGSPGQLIPCAWDERFVPIGLGLVAAPAASVSLPGPSAMPACGAHGSNSDLSLGAPPTSNTLCSHQFFLSWQ